MSNKKLWIMILAPHIAGIITWLFIMIYEEITGYYSVGSSSANLVVVVELATTSIASAIIKPFNEKEDNEDKEEKKND